MEKMRFLKSEVQSFLEQKILDNVATGDELELYENLIWNGKLKRNYTYKLVIKQMKRVYDGF